MSNTKPLELLKEHWRSVLACLALGLGGALLATTLMPKTYTATATMYVSAKPGEADADLLLESGQLSQQRMRSYVELATNERIGREVASELKLGMTGEQLLDHVEATSPANTVVLNIAASDTSPDMAAQIANSVAAAFNRLVSQLERPTDPTAPPIITAQVVEAASAPSDPVWPDRRLNVGLGAVVGLLIGIGVAAVRNRFDSSLKSVEALRAITPAAVLGRIPHDRRMGRRPVAVHERPLSPAAEAFRQLRTNLLFLNSMQDVKTVMVTSPVRNEGRTTVVCNLAVAMAQVGKRVMVVDADLRQPRAAAYLEIEEAPGLSEVLAGETKLTDAIRSWGGGAFDVLASGSTPTPTNPSELLDSPMMANLMRDLQARYDFILVDVPPLLPVTDAVALTKLMDGTILLARHGTTNVDQLKAAVASLATVSAPLTGTVLTGAHVLETPRGLRQNHHPRPIKQTDRAEFSASLVTAAAEPSATPSSSSTPMGNERAALELPLSSPRPQSIGRDGELG